MEVKIRKCKTEETNIANELLTKLIRFEKQFDNNINENCTVNYYYESVIDNPSHLILFAQIEEKIIGYIYGFIQENGDTTKEKVGQIDALYIEEEYRNMKVGDKLITEFIEWAKEQNVKIIEISVFDTNIKARNLYTKKNFKSVKTTMNLIVK